MILKKSIWTKSDIIEFQKYLETFENKTKIEWCRNILNTKMPLLAMKTVDIKNIVNEILKGNYLSFLDFMVWQYYENTAINGFLISTIKDFELRKKYLDIYSIKAENWATCDLLTFNHKGNEEKYFELTKEYIKSEKPFVRRIGINFLFKLVDYDEYIDRIFSILNSFQNENEYYVNMVNAWLICDCFIKQREKTLKFLSNNCLNKFTINKAISKCRDSRRVSSEDKEMLLKYKIK